MKNITNNKRRLIIVAGIVVAIMSLAAAGILIARSFSTNESTPIISEPAPDRLTDEQSEAKKQLQESTDNLPSKEGTSSSSDSDLSDSSADFAVSRNSGNVIVTTEIREINNGTCLLSVTNGGSSYSFEAGVLYQPGFSTCQGFTISPSQAGGSGTWQIRLTVNGEQGEKVQVTKEYRVE